MSENTKQTQPPPNNIVSTESITLPIMVETVPPPDWLNTNTDISNNILDKITRPILRRHSPLLFEKSSNNINKNKSLIDIMDEHDKYVNIHTQR
ncbi:hypothetical protein OAS95_02710 [Pelagibacteraceae bacterium]|nr:hypothetical protein [Pelagibacteraceae bacterium]